MGVLAFRDFNFFAVCPSGYLRASCRVYKIGCFLVLGISLPAAQLFVVAIENILWKGVCNLTSIWFEDYSWIAHQFHSGTTS